ncbi:MAG TPA: methyltransferase domain-containing protein [Alphaproteobacteria bacterium]|jgi:phosphatidylethanolamine/phosphatidyl-N-methylethanolamine N-methyltransferase
MTIPSDPSGSPRAGAGPVDERRALRLFLRRWLANPLRVGAVAPSAPALARRMAREARIRPGEAVVELGAGTGAVTRALIAAGVPEDRLILVERDRHMCAFLKEKFPGATVVRGDAARLDRLVPERWRGRVSTVVSGLPLVNLPRRECDAIVHAAFAVLAPDGRFVQYTYSPFSPLRRGRLGLEGRKVGFAGVNLPPATVWRYTRPASATSASGISANRAMTASAPSAETGPGA